MAKREALVQSDGQIEQKPTGDFLNIGKLSLGNPQIQTINSDTLALTGRTSFILIFTFTVTTLKWITGGQPGDILIIGRQNPNNSLTIVNTGNIKLPNTIVTTGSFAGIFIFNGASWLLVGFSNNV